MTSSRTYGAIIFDLDGLMLDTETLARSMWRKSGDELGYPINDELYNRLVGRTQADCDAILLEQLGSGFPFQSMREHIAFHWARHIEQHPVPRKPGLLELLHFIDASGIGKAVATSSRKLNALQKLGELALRFDIIVTGDDVARGKPAPDIFLFAAGQLQQSPAQCLVLEDSWPGVQAARTAGMDVIMVPDLAPPHDQATHVCASLHEVLAFLKNRPVTPS
ncbi:MAG: HAD family phosphatase [Methylacidiphilales bacterium]|nr:HAD family phosphatase [Candidatus Methylacidiphilales bacterium]